MTLNASRISSLRERLWARAVLSTFFSSPSGSDTVTLATDLPPDSVAYYSPWRVANTFYCLKGKEEKN